MRYARSFGTGVGKNVSQENAANPVMVTDQPLAGTTSTPQASTRLMSLDALRGFDMFWILGAGSFFIQLDAVVNGANGQPITWIRALAEQMRHKDWEGITFTDLIFPLFVFIVGVSIVFSLGKARLTQRTGTMAWRIARRALLLFALGVFYTGGLSKCWPDVGLSGVLHRIALCYLGASVLFCLFRPALLVAATALLLLGYWALMALVPFPDLRLDRVHVEQAAVTYGTKDLATIVRSVPERTHGVYEKGYNLSNSLDARFMPGRMYDTYWSPEGLLSTIPAIASCLLGVLAGCLLRDTSHSAYRKVLYLALGGLAALGVGYAWSIPFPIVKKIWSSSYVLVAGGYSALLLAVFYLVIDIWKLQRWCQPFVWIGANSIAIYLLKPLLGFDTVARRLVGGDIAAWFDRQFGSGSGNLLVIAVSYLVILALMRFLYQRKIFLRV